MDMLVSVVINDNFDVPINISMELDAIEINGCGGTTLTLNVTEESQYLTSLGYPQLYKSDVMCVWKLLAPKDKHIVIEVIDLNMDTDPGISGNCLTLSDNADPYIFRGDSSLCEDHPSTRSWTFWGSWMTLAFKTNTSGSGASFRVRMQAVEPDYPSRISTRTQAIIGGSVAGAFLLFAILDAICRSSRVNKKDVIAETVPDTNMSGKYDTSDQL
ncbi:tumor necrosis factor-inducible gene 6 protein [Aplysia californica]|uniref:Tumor necrosis factor-inducible gene 6 protein n=1 Tax=Aplysia californica TaxID=6500 RepID=A0ABM0ZWM8_APLCA|nr:tumor necrosis factor-inducible gene 6 protein [Aplysia californica]